MILLCLAIACFGVGALLSAIERGYVMALLMAGLAFWVATGLPGV